MRLQSMHSLKNSERQLHCGCEGDHAAISLIEALHVNFPYKILHVSGKSVILQSFFSEGQKVDYCIVARGNLSVREFFLNVKRPGINPRNALAARRLLRRGFSSGPGIILRLGLFIAIDSVGLRMTCGKRADSPPAGFLSLRRRHCSVV